MGAVSLRPGSATHVDRIAPADAPAHQLPFEGHTLLISANNVGKSTICEALDLILGPDRIHQFAAVEKFDFYNADCIYNTEYINAMPTIPESSG